MTIEKVVNAIKNLLYLRYPEAGFYIQNIPQGFERPSFYVGMVSGSSADLNNALTREKLSIRIAYFAPLNEHQMPEGENQLTVCQEVKDIFRRRFLQVEDRALEVSGLSMEIRENELYLVVDFEYLEERPQDENQENYELMQKIILKEVL